MEIPISQFIEMFGDPFENPKGYVKKTIGDVCDFQGGSQPPRKEFVFKPQEGYVRLIQIRDYKTDDYITYAPEKMCRRFCDADDIMIGRYGPPIFQILQGIEGAYNVALMKAIPHGINKEFMRAYLKRDELLHHLELFSTRTAGQSGIEMSELRGYPCLVPPEEEQLQYVEFVKQSDKSKFACLKSQFIEMFGDPVENPKDFDKCPLMSLAKKITDGVHKKPVYTKTGKPFISVTNINRGVIDFTDCKFVSEEAYQTMIKTTYPERGDVLYTKVGATYGIPAYVDTDEQFGLYVSVCLIKPKHDLIDARFLTESMRMEYIKKQADDRIKGIGVPDLHLQEIKSFEVLCPPRELQEQFVAFVQQSDKSK